MPRRVNPPYEIFEHTADIGIKISGNDLPELFTHAAFGLFNLVTDFDRIKLQEKREEAGSFLDLEIEAADLQALLLCWLRELLFLFSTRRLLFTRFEFTTLAPGKLKARLSAIPFYPDRDEAKHEVKAITYHQFEVKQTLSGWEAKVIIDI